jgi:hypothetical protein
MNLHLFVLAMMLHPHVFKKAQQEVDKVCGSCSPPTAEYRTKLPYLQAIMLEVRLPTPFQPPIFPYLETQSNNLRSSAGAPSPPEANPTS